MIKNKRVMITGGGGFIGTSLTKRLIDDNEVILLDRDFSDNAYAYSNLKDNEKIKKQKIDILDLDALSEATKDVDIVVHMAAMVGVQEVISNAMDTLEVNYSGTSNILKAVSTSPNCKRLVYFSTSEIFGPNAFRVAENADSALASVQDVRWCYCISKLAAEHLVFSYSRQKGLPVVVIRPFNVFGAGRVGDHVVVRFILKALNNEDLEVYGDGTQIRAWCYIDDFCDALVKSLEVEGAIGQTFNIGNPLNTVTVYALAEDIVRLCNSKSEIIFKAPGFADVDLRIPNINKAKEILGFNPQVKLEDGLNQTIEWVKQHESELRQQVSKRRREYIV
jgi:UDP-glucose 4-epimerase